MAWDLVDFIYKKGKKSFIWQRLKTLSWWLLKLMAGHVYHKKHLDQATWSLKRLFKLGSSHQQPPALWRLRCDDGKFKASLVYTGRRWRKRQEPFPCKWGLVCPWYFEGMLKVVLGVASRQRKTSPVLSYFNSGLEWISIKITRTCRKLMTPPKWSELELTSFRHQHTTNGEQVRRLPGAPVPRLGSLLLWV